MGGSGDRLETDLTCCFGTVPCISPIDCLTFAETRDPVLALCQFLQRWTMNQRTDSQDQRNCSSSQRSKEARCLAQFMKKELRIGTATSGSRSRLKVQGPPEGHWCGSQDSKPELCMCCSRATAGESNPLKEEEPGVSFCFPVWSSSQLDDGFPC